MRPTPLPILLAALTLLLFACGKEASQAHHPQTEPQPPAQPGEEDASTHDLPPRFTDQVPQFARVQNEDGSVAPAVIQTIPFDMILIPGDAEQGIAPFYLGETEVTWAMMESWAYCRDLADQDEVVNLIAAGLRPSYQEGDAAIAFNMDNPHSPVIGTTRLTAEAFCIYLSQLTGRKYRLPTPAEWRRALDLGGGCPEDPDALLALGSFRENSLDPDDLFNEGGTPDDPWATFTTSDVKSHPPNALGLYDMLGNAGEWVVEPDGPAYLVGGHHALPAQRMSADWTDVEDHDIWNAWYPNVPYSRFWYSGENNYQGFRLVCEVEAVAP